MASSSSLSRSWLYDVFVSFRGEDVRKGFLSHVLEGLESKGIVAFVDDEMKRGQSIDAELLGAIRQSRVAIVLLSRNYASSSWCLDELVEIMKCREDYQQTVMTIFYEVDPSDVRNQTGDFGKAFDETCVRKTEEVKQAWRKALKDVAGIAGYHSSNCDNEAEMINKVASDVTAVLGFTPSKDFDDFVGIGAHITNIKSKLILQSEEFKVIVVSGPAGIGKTTTARVLYNQLSPGFPFSTFLENIKGSYEKPCGNDYQLKLLLQKNLLSEIFNQKDIVVGHLGVAQQRLSDRKVLIVLDEVDSLWQLEATAYQSGWVGPGSIIIITTEDRKLPRTLGLGNDHIYQMKFPTSDESLQILCQYAFGQNSPYDGFEELAREVTWLAGSQNSPYDGFEWLAREFTWLAGSLPLALRVMGSYLRGMSRDEWIDALPRLRSSLDREIESTLRFSYDSLHDKDKALFLHIACFFLDFNCRVDSIKNCLEKSGLEFTHGLKILYDRSFISVDDLGFIVMHRLLRQMGREIVKKQASEEPGKRQFLWDTTDISDVLYENTGTGTVLGILLLDIKNREEIEISKSAFDGMNNLQFLYVLYGGNLRIPEGLNCLPHKLRFIFWYDCPLRIWPSKFSAKFLVELIMRKNKFEKLWEGIQPLPCLKVMDLRSSEYLKEIPDLSKGTSLETLDVSGCESLLELTSSIGNATKLYRLDMSGCRNLKEFPNVPDSIVELELSRTEIVEIPSSIENLFRLEKLIMHGSTKLEFVSSNISKLENLRFLCLGFDNCRDPAEYMCVDGTDFFDAIIEGRLDFKRFWLLRSDFGVHEIFETLPEKALTSTISLSFSGDSLYTIPDYIGRLSGLMKLAFTRCDRLESLPRLPDSLVYIDAYGCESLKSIDSSSFQNPMYFLNFANCFNLNQEARNLIQSSTCKYVCLPGEEVPADFTHQSSSASLTTINMTPTHLHSSFRFKACILLSCDEKVADPYYNLGYDEEGDYSLSYRVRGKQNGHTVHYVSDQLHMTRRYIPRKHLYIFQDFFSLNEDCFEARETTFSELSFVFIIDDKAWKVEGCGVELLEEIPLCIPDGNVDDDNDGD